MVVHQDIKPSNILVTDDGNPILLDFGIAEILDYFEGHHSNLTITQLQPHTPEYAAHEQIKGETCTTSTDVYSLGILLYELLTECKPFKLDNLTPLEIERVICETEPRVPSKTKPVTLINQSAKVHSNFSQ